MNHTVLQIKLVLVLALMVSLFGAARVLAVPVTVNAIGADWTNIQGGMNVSYHDTDGIAGNEEVRWGFAATENGSSGYRFDSAAPASFDVETGSVFSLGNFTHFNQPIFHSISGAQLDITMDLTIAGITLMEGPFSFSFLHNETSNTCEPQPDCANDIVSFVNPVISKAFLVSGVEYTLELIGFAVNGGLTTEFSTLESENNVAQLLGVFKTPIVVPAPASIALFALGLFAIGFVRRHLK